MRLCQKKAIPPMSRTRLAVTTEESGLVVNEPPVDQETNLRVANGVAEVKPNKPFWLFVCNFGRVERHLPKNMVI